MWVQYLRPAELHRDSAVNLLAARLLLAAGAFWKLASEPYAELPEWPLFLFETNPQALLPGAATQLAWLPAERGLALLLLVAFGLGVRVGPVSWILAALLAHMSSLHYAVTNGSHTWFLWIYLILLYGVFRGDGAGRTDHSFLRWALVTLAATYFFAGFDKLRVAGLAWADPSHLAIIVHRDLFLHHEGVPWAARPILASGWISGAGGLATLVLECGFLPAVLARLALWPWVLGLAGMHALVGAAMGIVFFDQLFFFALFLRWDGLAARLTGGWSRARSAGQAPGRTGAASPAAELPSPAACPGGVGSSSAARCS